MFQTRLKKLGPRCAPNFTTGHGAIERTGSRQGRGQEAHGIDRDDILDVQGLELLAESKGGEPYLVRNYDRSRVFALHFPSEAVLPFEIAERGTWLSHRALLLRNWINYYVYQPVSQFLQERDGRPAA